MSRKSILKINIELSPGHEEVLLVREGESADLVAKAFATKFGLSDSMQNILREQIFQSLNKSFNGGTGFTSMN
jgi:hypothetical protein